MEKEKTKVKETKTLTLDEKILELKKIVSIMQKDATGHGYKYVTEESILLAINDKMIELGLRLIPKFKNGTLKTEIVNYKNGKGQDKTDVKVEAEMYFIWKDIYTGEIEEIDWILVGQQADGSQALGSGLTYATRYFLLKYFNVATSEDDPDKIRSEIAKAEERKTLSSTQTKSKKLFNDLITKYQSNETVYTKLGTTREQFLKDYNDNDKLNNLIEQMELLLKEDSNA